MATKYECDLCDKRTHNHANVEVQHYETYVVDGVVRKKSILDICDECLSVTLPTLKNTIKEKYLFISAGNSNQKGIDKITVTY